MPYNIVRMSKTEQIQTIWSGGGNKTQLEKYEEIINRNKNADKDAIVNYFTQKKAEEFKVGCSYFGVVAELEYDIMVVGFTITKINKNSIHYKTILSEDNKIFYEPQTIKKRPYQNKTIMSSVIKKIKKKTEYETNNYPNNHAFVGITPNMCYEINDITIIKNLINDINYENEEDHTYTSKDIKYIYDTPHSTELIDF